MYLLFFICFPIELCELVNNALRYLSGEHETGNWGPGSGGLGCFADSKWRFVKPSTQLLRLNFFQGHLSLGISIPSRYTNTNSKFDIEFSDMHKNYSFNKIYV